MSRRQLELTGDQIQLLYAKDKLYISDEEVFEQFVDSKKLIGVKPRTVQIYRDVKRVVDRDAAILDFDCSMKDYTTEHVERLMLYWQRVEISPVTVNHRLRVLKPYYKFLYEKGFKDSFILKNVKNVREKVEIKDTLEREEIQQISQYFKKKKSFAGFRDLVMFQFFLDTGVRISEALAIQLQDIHGTTVHIVEPKGLKQRTVFLSDQMRDTLDIYLEIRGIVDTEYLFVTVDGNKLVTTTYQEDLREAVRHCGIKKKITPHSLRRTYAKFAVLAGIDPFSLAALLGHSSLEVTTRYVQIWGQDLRRQSEKRGNFSGLF